MTGRKRPNLSRLVLNRDDSLAHRVADGTALKLEISHPRNLDEIYCGEIAANNERELPKRVAPTTHRQGRAVLSTLDKYFTFASWLCLVDCTVLPILTFVIQLLGVANLASTQAEFMHTIGDFITVYFLLPVGCLTTIRNYATAQSENRWTSFLGVFGLVLVALTNAYSLPGIGHLETFHFLHRGMWHRVVNVMGCSFLMASKHLSHQQSAHCKKKKDFRCCVLDCCCEDKTGAERFRTWRRRRIWNEMTRNRDLSDPQSQKLMV